MRTESHLQLGKTLLQSWPQASLSQRVAFLLGCIEPDLNAFTYLRGFLRDGHARGHNFHNILPSMIHLAARLEVSGLCAPCDAYRLGKLMHYVVDAFTYTHNEAFQGSIAAHNRYEKKLEAHFLDMLSSQGAVPSPVRGGFLTLLCDQHQHYLNETPGIDTDTRFALHVAPLAFSLFVLRRNAFQKLMEEIA